MKNLPLSSNFERYCDNHVFKFPVIVDTKFESMNRIHPYVQAYVVKILENELLNNIVEKLAIFGSSINPKCRKTNDIDIYIVLEDKAICNECRNALRNIDVIIDLLSDITSSFSENKLPFKGHFLSEKNRLKRNKFDIYFENDYRSIDIMTENIKRGAVIINGKK